MPNPLPAQTSDDIRFGTKDEEAAWDHYASAALGHEIALASRPGSDHPGPRIVAERAADYADELLIQRRGRVGQNMRKR